MVLTTPFHPRLAELNTAELWGHWSGHLSATQYTTAPKHEYFGVRNAVGLFDASPLYKYAISGRDGKNGYLQRLAVSPEHQHRGHGATLVCDAVRWMARWRVQRALVNTHVGNDAALALYHRVGFTDLEDRLHVYERRIE